MISYITGTIKNIDIMSVIISTSSGVGYELIINELVYANIYDKTQVEMYVYHNISENGQSLFGFLSFEDRSLFKELIKISGVGGRVAQNILSLGSNRLKKAIFEDDKKTIESVKGVGKKMAEKIVLELQDKDIIQIQAFETKSEKGAGNKSLLEKNQRSEIISTLTMMGYHPKKVEDILDTLPEGYETLEKIIPYVIKNI